MYMSGTNVSQLIGSSSDNNNLTLRSCLEIGSSLITNQASWG